MQEIKIITQKNLAKPYGIAFLKNGKPIPYTRWYKTEAGRSRAISKNGWTIVHSKNVRKERQYRSNQGRSPERMTKIYKSMFWCMLGLTITVLILILFK